MKLLCPVVETNVSTRRTNSVCAELKYQCDGKNAVTLVSPLAVTGISIHTQYINPTFVTDDSKLLKIFFCVALVCLLQKLLKDLFSPTGRLLAHLEYHRAAIHYILMSDKEIVVFLSVQGHRLDVDVLGRLTDGTDTEFLVAAQF